MEQMYSLTTVAKMWDMTVRHLRRLLKGADIRLYKIGTAVKVKESDLLALVASSDENADMDSYL